MKKICEMDGLTERLFLTKRQRDDFNNKAEKTEKICITEI